MEQPSQTAPISVWVFCKKSEIEVMLQSLRTKRNLLGAVQRVGAVHDAALQQGIASRPYVGLTWST